MRVRTWYRTATAFAGTAVASLIGSYVALRNSGIEGAYFSRNSGAPAYAGTFTADGNPWLGYALLGGGIAFTIAALVVALLARRRID